ncbi:amino acid ABC transporter permease [Rhizobium sp. RM]|uniref:amino acid ABC transporter permease n=1 Tax=Rhizobium/Agrobacterium group TaxID=227290 RepID=UPI00110EB57D|nr:MULTISPECIES: amino acid ABC transporter permease [Rhizobium/Agrobacterium group]MDS7594398.1 amino acid ABC transporter permease [Agrobacterium tumefaciens]NWJ24361.1 amino acid ABC transporter permease [Rhizobium sp. RM]TMV21090.1 amino acid ABC transporter permease [Rhizobium sp. Td3]
MAVTDHLHSSELPIVHRRRWGAWIFGAIALLIVVTIVQAAFQSRIINVGVFANYIFSPLIVMGAVNALILGTLALFIASVIGFVAALMRVSGNPILVAISATYVYLFRGTPMLIQLIFWFNAVPIMFPSITISLPFMAEPLVSAPTTTIVTPFLAALAGLSLAEGAYMSEIIRAGILAVDKGQRAAATALGMTQRQVLVQVVIPQAGRIIIPAAGNQYIMLLKSSSLASAIGYLELLRVATDIYSSNFHVVELLAVAAFWYLVMTAFATAIQTILEKVFPQR